MIIYHIDEPTRTVWARFDVCQDHVLGQTQVLDENFVFAAAEAWSADLRRRLWSRIYPLLDGPSAFRQTVERVVIDAVHEVMAGRVQPSAFIGLAKCAPSDVFDEEVGKRLARERLLHKFTKAQRHAESFLRMKLGAQACDVQRLTQRLHERVR